VNFQETLYSIILRLLSDSGGSYGVSIRGEAFGGIVVFHDKKVKRSIEENCETIDFMNLYILFFNCLFVCLSIEIRLICLIV